MKTVIDIVNDAILDVCSNPLVENGTFDPNNDDHMFLLMETLDGNLEEEYITKAVSALKCEGKHPDRQAYNKEGWLVTFPSKEYRDAAIKKGTHALSDPTHGKGGMNLYYKRKGKQKRMTQQAQSAVGNQQVAPQPPPATEPTQPVQPSTSSKKEEPSAQKEPAAQPDTSKPVDKGSSELPSSDVSQDSTTSSQPEKKEEPTTQNQPKPEDSSTPIEPQQTEEKPTTSSFKDISEKFAKSKGWSPTPYGEWRDQSGTSAAVVSLSGEIVPIKSTDRDELKIFSEKQY